MPQRRTRNARLRQQRSHRQRGGHNQWLNNTGYLNGHTFTTNHYFKGQEVALANPTPFLRTLSGGRRKSKRCGCRKVSLRRLLRVY